MRSAEERSLAAKEAEAIEREGRVILVRHRYRRFIQKVRLPLAEEPVVRGLRGLPEPGEMRARAVAAVREASARVHPVLPELWSAWTGELLEDPGLENPRRFMPWHRPELVRELLGWVFGLTAREWGPGTLVRDAEVALGLPTKTLEKRRGLVESALSRFFQQEGRMGMGALNLAWTHSVAGIHGPLKLILPNGEAEPGRHLHGVLYLSAEDLERAVSIHTDAAYILTVENTKVSFRDAAAANSARSPAARGLVVASSFPTRAVRLLLEKLPADLPHYHFGDTDAAGYSILAKLRSVHPARSVQPWLMEWREAPSSPPLTLYDRRTAAALLAEPAMADFHPDLQRMLQSERKGNFEQEHRAFHLPPAGIEIH
ncbi:MAG: hypothetical protein JWL81_2642 [Verrucomicrobiales bacterium]|nr:hypothetical protein [Verrucomicrobiales bacterium]